MLEIDGNQYPVIFPAFLKHKEVAEGIRESVFSVDTVCSAGFIEEVNVHYVHGKSFGLDLESRLEDEEIMEQVNREG